MMLCDDLRHEKAVCLCQIELRAFGNNYELILKLKHNSPVLKANNNHWWWVFLTWVIYFFVSVYMYSVSYKIFACFNKKCYIF